MVKGDLIITQSNRIKTRSQAKQSIYHSPHGHFVHSQPNRIDPDPDQYTIIPATAKILKVLVEELLSASGTQAATNAAAAAISSTADLDAADDDDDGDDGWEDEPDTIDLSLGATKADLLSYLETSAGRQRDDETQAYLSEFFVRAAKENVAGFEGWYANYLNEDEKMKLQELAQ
jgi:importin-9